MTPYEIVELKARLPRFFGKSVLGHEFLLRPFRSNTREWEALARHIGTSRIADRVSSVPHPYTQDDAAAWTEYVLHSADLRLDFAIDMGRGVVGSVAFINIEGHDLYKAQVSMWLAEEHQRKGIMTAALAHLIAFGATCGFKRIWGYTSDDNRASQSVLMKAGFTLEGVHRKEWYKNGRYHDSHVYAVIGE